MNRSGNPQSETDSDKNQLTDEELKNLPWGSSSPFIKTVEPIFSKKEVFSGGKKKEEKKSTKEQWDEISENLQWLDDIRVISNDSGESIFSEDDLFDNKKSPKKEEMTLTKEQWDEISEKTQWLGDIDAIPNNSNELIFGDEDLYDDEKNPKEEILEEEVNRLANDFSSGANLLDYHYNVNGSFFKEDDANVYLFTPRQNLERYNLRARIISPNGEIMVIWENLREDMGDLTVVYTPIEGRMRFKEPVIDDETFAEWEVITFERDRK